MTSTPRDIPGFYYDEEKKKYFRIQPNHATAAGTEQYTQDAVKDRNEGSKRRRLEDLHRNRERHQTIIRSKLRDPRLAGLVLNARLGGIDKPNRIKGVQGLAEWYAKSLERRPDLTKPSLLPLYGEYHRMPRNSPGVIFARGTTKRLLGSVKQFVRDDQTGALIAAAHRHGLPFLEAYAQNSFYSFQNVRSEPMARDDTEIQMLLTSQRSLVMTSNGGMGDAGYLDIRQLMDPALAMEVADHPIEYNHVALSFNFPERTFWATAASPNGNRIAVASNMGVYVLNSAQGQWNITQQAPGRAKEYLALQWQSDNVYMAGRRRGTIDFHDVRVGAFTSRLAHPNAVNGIRMIDDVRVLVRGLSKMCVYDLRYAKKPKPKHTELTEPYLRFPGYHGAQRFTQGLDFDPDLQIIVSASDVNIKNTIQLFSTKTGHELSSPLKEYSMQTPKAPARRQRGLINSTYPQSLSSLQFTPSIMADMPLKRECLNVTEYGGPLKDILLCGAGDIECWSACGWDTSETYRDESIDEEDDGYRPHEHE